MGAIHHADRYFSVDVSQTVHDSTLLREHMTLLDRQSRSVIANDSFAMAFSGIILN